MTSIIGLVISLVIAGLIFWLVIWVVDWVGVPEPFNKVIKVIIGLVVVLYLFGILTGFAPPVYRLK